MVSAKNQLMIDPVYKYVPIFIQIDNLSKQDSPGKRFKSSRAWPPAKEGVISPQIQAEHLPGFSLPLSKHDPSYEILRVPVGKILGASQPVSNKWPQKKRKNHEPHMFFRIIFWPEKWTSFSNLKSSVTFGHLAMTPKAPTVGWGEMSCYPDELTRFT